MDESLTPLASAAHDTGVPEGHGDRSTNASYWRRRAATGRARTRASLCTLAVVALGAGGLLLSGGGSVGAAAVSDAVRTSTAFSTVHVALQVSVTMGAKSFGFSGNGGVDFAKDAAELTVSATAGQKFTAKLVYVNDVAYINVPALASFLGGKSWVSLNVSSLLGTGAVSDLNSGLDPSSWLQVLSQPGNQVTTLGPSTIGGTAVKGYSVVVSPTNLKAALTGADLPAWIGSALGTLATPTVGLKLYVDAGNLVRRVTVAVQATTGCATPVTVQVSAAFSAYGTPVSVTAPPSGQVLTVGGFLPSLFTSGAAGGTSCTTPGTPTKPPGYDLAGSDGGVFVFPTGQSSGFFGSLPGLGVPASDIVGIVPTNHDHGYDLVGRDGGVFVFPVGQTKGFFGSLPGLGVPVNDIVGIVPTNHFNGYDLVGRDGGVFVFPTGQSSGFFGSLPGETVHVDNIVGIAVTGDDQGYWLAASTGRVYNLGDAPAVTSPQISSPIVGIAADATSQGGWLVSANGSVYTFGDATSFGTLPGSGTAASDIVSIVPTPSGKGYWIIGANGQVYPEGDATNQGTLPNLGVGVGDVVGAVPTG